jgi:Icc-related predicted phosphoesterase
MRILAASDIHGRHGTFRWLADALRHTRADALVLAGDLLGVPDGFETVESAQQSDAVVVAALLGSLPVPVYYIMGNDDLVELRPETNNVRSLNLARVEQGAYNFVGYQFSLPFMGGVFEKSEDAIARDLATIAPLMDERTVFVTHSPALGLLDDTLLGHAGSASIRDVVDKRGVRIHIHGHIHGCFGRSGLHFNVAAAGRRRAMLVDVDAVTHEVVGEAA